MMNMNDEMMNYSQSRPHYQRDRYQADLEFTATLMKKIKDDKNQGMNFGFYSSSKPCTKKSIDQLTPITLNQMMVPKIHYNTYFLCRTISTPLYSIGSVETLIEDTNGDVEQIVLQNINSVIPKGTIMIVKEPHLGKSVWGNHDIIACHTPSDIIFIDETDELLKETGWMLSLTESFEEIKQKADKMFKNKKYEEAIKYYTRALKIEDNPVINLNRAACYLQLEKSYYANEDSMVAFKADVNKEKSLYRLGKAAYGLRRWKEAVDHFSRLLESYPKNKEAIQELEKSKERLRESQTGNYDIHRLYDEAYVKKERFIDVADYTGPVEVVEISENNKGLVATEDIKKGTLVLVSKAFSICYDGTMVDIVANQSYFTDNEKAFDLQKNFFLVNYTIKALENNPHKADEIYSLYSGDIDRSEKLPTSVIDNIRIQNICKYNSILTEVIRNPGDLNHAEDVTYRHNANTGHGLWILPSYINHSCIPNCYRTFYGDIMTVYAIQDIKKGQEITVTYVDPFTKFQIKTIELKRYNINCCMCRLCVVERDDKFIEARSLLNKEYEGKFEILIPNNLKAAVILAHDLYSKMKSLYKNRNEFKFDLLYSLRSLAGPFLVAGDIEQALCYFKQIINIYGEPFIYFEISDPYFLIARLNNNLGREKMAKFYLNEAFKANKIRMGGDEKLFKIIFCNALKQYNLYDLI